MLQLPKTKRLVAFLAFVLALLLLACAVTNSARNQRMAAGRIQRMAAVPLAPWMQFYGGMQLVF